MKVIKKFSYLCFLILFSLIILGSDVLAQNKTQNLSGSATLGNSTDTNYTVNGGNTTITLNGDISTSSDITMEVTGGANVTVYGNNHSISSTSSGTAALVVRSGNVTLNNVNVTGGTTVALLVGSVKANNISSGNLTMTGGSIATGGALALAVAQGNAMINNVTVNYTGNKQAIQVGGSGNGQKFPASLTIGGGSTINATGTQAAGILISAADDNTPSTVNLNDCTINSDGEVVTTNGNPAQGTGRPITVNVGQNNTNPTLTSSNNVGMYLPDDDAIVNIYSGTITGLSGICIRGGTLNINGGTITGNYTKNFGDGGVDFPGPIANGSGILAVGDEKPNDDSYGQPVVNINGGTIESENYYGISQINYKINGQNDPQYNSLEKININGGTILGGTDDNSDEYGGLMPGMVGGGSGGSQAGVALKRGVVSGNADPDYLKGNVTSVGKVETSDGPVSFFGLTFAQAQSILEANGVTVEGPAAYEPVAPGGAAPELPQIYDTIVAVNLGDNFLSFVNYTKEANTESPQLQSQNIGLSILSSGNNINAANALDWEITSLNSNAKVTFENDNNPWFWQNYPGGSNVTAIQKKSDDGNWTIAQQVTFSGYTNTNDPIVTATGNAYLIYNGMGSINAGLYELTAEALDNTSATDSVRFTISDSEVTGVTINPVEGQRNPVTFNIAQTQSYDFEFTTEPADARADVVEWSLDMPSGSGYLAEDYAYVNPKTGNVTFLQATPPDTYLTLSVTVNGVVCSDPMVIELTGDWTVETGIKPFVNPVTVQSNQAYNLSGNIVANPTNVPIGNTNYLTFEVADNNNDVLISSGKLIPKNTNYSGVVSINAAYNDGSTESSTNFSVIFTPRAVSPTGVTAESALNFVTGDLTTQNVNAGLSPLGTVQGSAYTPGTTAQITSTSFVYTTSNPAVAVVDESGNVKAVTEGTATITTALKDENDGNDIIIVPPAGTTPAEAEVAKTQVTVTSIPTQVPATGITATPEEIYLSPTNVEDGTHEQTVTVTVAPENTTDSVTAESGNINVATVTGEGNNSFRVSAVSDGNTTVTFTAGSASATVPVSVNSEEIISSGLTYSANSPDTFSITAGGVMVNPAIPSLQGTRIDNVTFMAWSGPDQGDMQTFTVNSSGNESFTSGTFTVNGNDHYFYNADNIFVEAYANNSQVYLGSLSPNYDWINTSTAGSNDTVAYITYQENNGFNTPTVFNGQTSGVTGKNLQLEGIRVSSNIEGVDVVTDVHLQDLGWVEAVNDGVYAGTQHQARQMEAIRLRLVGDNALSYDIWAQGHVQNTGWMQPVKLGNNVDFVGTTGKALQLEAVKIQIVPKGQTPAGWEAFN